MRDLTSSPFVWNTSTVYTLKSITSMIHIINTLGDIFDPVLSSISRYTIFNPIEGPYAEPSAHSLRRAIKRNDTKEIEKQSMIMDTR